jgi:hypothetical protein
LGCPCLPHVPAYAQLQVPTSLFPSRRSIAPGLWPTREAVRRRTYATAGRAPGRTACRTGVEPTEPRFTPPST